MHLDPTFSQRVNSFQRRVASFRNAPEKSPPIPQEVLVDMETAAEELRTAEEEIRHQNEELRDTRNRLDQERRRYHDLFDLAPDGYLVTDASAIIGEANRAAAEILATRPKLLPGKSLLFFLHRDDIRIARHQMTLAQQTGAPAEWTARLTPHASPACTVSMTVAPIFDTSAKDPPCIGYRWLLRDISDRIRAETSVRTLSAEVEELRARQASRIESPHADRAPRRATRHDASDDKLAGDSFLALIAHELRNPLVPVQIAVDSLLASKNLNPADLREKLLMIQRNLAAQRRLIDDLLDVTRIVHGKLDLQPQPLHLHPLLEEILAESRDALAAKNITLHADLAAKQNLLHADPIRLRQVFWNLLNNAIKFTPAGGRIFVRTAADPLRDGLIVEIEDTGVGIPPDTLKTLFQPFDQGDSRYARAQGGLGLGLSIARSLVHAHRGSISINSNGVGKGAAVRVLLPLTELSASAPPAPPSPSTAKGLLVCLVDDHFDTVRAMSQILAAWGNRILSAYTVADAIDLLSKNTVDLLISDLNLPDGSAGQILRAVPRANIKRAVALSGATGKREQSLCLNAGFEKLLPKPISLELLQQLLHSSA